MTYYIGSARHDENGRYAGGKAGDQTGNEVATQKMYNYPSRGGWDCYRFKNPWFGVACKNAMLTACGNRHIGYSQSDRYGIIRNGTNTKKDCNADCSTLVRECIKEASNVDVGDFTTLSEGATLEISGLFIKTEKVTTLSRLYEGDILVTRKKGHTVIVTTGHSRMDEVISSPKSDVAINRSHGLKYAQTFCNDTALGINTRTKTQVLQHALNLDYGAGLIEDGILGQKTKRALGNHYVEYGEKQYLVSAAEILVYLLGGDAGGYECKGIYGNGLKKATGLKRLNAAWFLSKVK